MGEADLAPQLVLEAEAGLWRSIVAGGSLRPSSSSEAALDGAAGACGARAGAAGAAGRGPSPAAWRRNAGTGRSPSAVFNS